MSAIAENIPLTSASNDNDEAEVLYTVQKFIGSIAKGDKTSMLALILPEGGATLYRPPHVIHTNITAAIDRIPLDGSMGQLDEQIHDVKVMATDQIAMAWVPNEFYVNGQIAHIGTTVMTLLKVDGKWLISSTVDNCRKMVISQK